MDNDENDFEKKLQKFSVVQMCPMCKKLSLSFKNGLLMCTNCGYNKNIPAVR